MTSVNLDGDEDEVLRAWLVACQGWTAQIAELTEKRNRAIELIKQRLGDAEQATAYGKPVISWAWSKPAKYIDVKALAADMPEVAEKYTREKTPARPFKILDGWP